MYTYYNIDGRQSLFFLFLENSINKYVHLYWVFPKSPYYTRVQDLPRDHITVI